MNGESLSEFKEVSTTFGTLTHRHTLLSVEYLVSHFEKLCWSLDTDKGAEGTQKKKLNSVHVTSSFQLSSCKNTGFRVL